MDRIQVFVMLGALIAFVGLGFMFSFSIKKHDAKKQAQKKKKGRTKYMPEVKKFGR